MKLSVSGISFHYGDKQILNQVDFQIKKGEFVSILGTSGGGKSTILNLLSGMLTPDEGTILLDGAPLGQRKNFFAYMPQEDLLFPWKTVMDNVCLYGKIHGNLAEIRGEAEKHMKSFGLAGYENAYPKSLSGGMRQRAAFLRTALCKAEVLLLDEPFGALDVITRGEMQDWLLSMRNELDRTVLLVTHDMDEAIYLSDRILILGGEPASIIAQIKVEETKRDREWLYRQGELRQEIYKEIMGHGKA